MRHTLLDEDDTDTSAEHNMDLIPTTDLLRNMDVVYDEVLDTKAELNVEPEEFIITPIENKAEPIIEEKEEQITLTFDLPLSNNEPETVEEPESGEEMMFFSLDEDVKDIDVNEPVEIISVTEVNEEGEKRYALEDVESYESSINAKVETEVKEEIVFEKKVLPTEETKEVSEDEIDPMNSPISDLIKARADERRKQKRTECRLQKAKES